MKKAILAAVIVLVLCGLAAGGSALEFDGVDDYVNLGNDSSLKVPLPVTLSAWIKLDGAGTSRQMITLDDPTLAHYGIWFGVRDTGTLTLSYGDGGSSEPYNRRSKFGETTLQTGIWYHVVGIIKGPLDMEHYINGQLDGGVYDGTGGDLAYSDGDSRIGSTGGVRSFFNGIIDELGVYDRALSTSEIEDIYHCGVFADVNLVGYWDLEEGAGQVAADGSGNSNDGQLGSSAGADSSDPAWVASEVPGVTYHVDVVNGDNGNDGLTKETAFAAIQMGIDTAEDCDRVLVWPGVYNESLFFINKGITVQSAADAAELVASGIYAASLYTSEGPESVLKNFVIRDSDTGVYVSSGAPWLEHLTIVNCDLGVEAEAGAEPNIVNSILWNNAYDLFQCEAQYSWVEEEMEANMVAYWRFEEGSGTTTYDWTGNNDGTIYGAAWTTGKVGGALEFDGSNDYVETSVIDLDDAVSLSAWIKASGGTGERCIVDNYETAGYGLSYNLSDNGKFHFGVRVNGAYRIAFSNSTVQLDRWYHVAGTYDGNNGYLYVDGIKQTDNFAESGVIDNSVSPVTIGANPESYNPPSTGFFNGVIDEVGIWDRALSTAEIERLYENGLAGHEYIDPVFADANGGDYHLKSERGRYWPEHDVWVLDEVSSGAIDAGDARVQPGGEPAANGGRINMGAYGNTAYASMSEWGLEADFDYDGAVGLDDVGSFTDEWLEAVSYSQEPAGSALEFDGVDDYVLVQENPSLEPNEITVAMWALLDGEQDYCSRLLRKINPSAKGGYILAADQDNDRTMQFRVRKDDPIIIAGDTQTHHAYIGTWHHFAGVYSNEHIAFYVDGIEVSRHSHGVGSMVHSDDLYIGAGVYDTGEYIKGTLDEVAIYSRALSASEIEDIYHCGVLDDVNLVGYWDLEEGEGQVASDSSGNGNDGQLGSSPNADSSDPAWVESDWPTGVTYHVDGAGGDNDNDGLTKETAFASIQFGIDKAEGCDRVLVWPGVYNESLFFINKGITVRSAAEAAEIVATGLYAASFYNFGGGDATISNFVITDSDTGIYVSSGQPVLTNLTVVGNWMGVEAEAGAEPDISNCIFWGNDYDLFQCTARYSLVEEQIGPNLIAYWELDGDATDSAGSNDGTIYGATSTTGQIGEALEFDGVDDYVDVGDQSNLEGFSQVTIAAWVYWQRPAEGTRDYIAGKEYVYKVDITSSTGNARFLTGNNWSGSILTSLQSIPSNTWTHIAATYDGSTKLMYVNGDLDGNSVSTSGSLGTNSNRASIGSYYYTGLQSWVDHFEGSIDEVGIWDRGLSAEEVEQLYEYGLRGQGVVLEPLFADANAGDYHLLSERGRYWPGQDVWVLDDVTSACVDGGDLAVGPAAEPMPNGARVNMGAYGGTAYASMSEWPIAGDMDEDGIVNMADYAIVADEWLRSLAWAE